MFLSERFAGEMPFIVAGAAHPSGGVATNRAGPNLIGPWLCVGLDCRNIWLIWTKQLRFLVLLSKYDSNLWLRRDWVQFEMGDDRHHPLLSLWLRHWFRRRVSFFASFVFQPKQWSGTTTGAGGHQTLSAVLRVWDIWLADRTLLLSHSRWSLCSLLWRRGVWSYKTFCHCRNFIGLNQTCWTEAWSKCDFGFAF